MHRCLFTVVVLLCLVPMDCVAQSVDPFFGMQGGFATSNSPMEVFSNHYYPPRYTFSDSPARWGPTVGIDVNDKIEIRFEPSRNNFHFESQSTTPYPVSGSKSTSVTDGHTWQYPIMLAYRLGNSRTIHPVVGGGITVSRSIKGVTNSEITTVRFPNPTETTTHVTSEFTYSGAEPIGFHTSFGVEFRKGFLSLRPEMRLGFWSDYRADDENQTIFSSNPMEFIVGVRIHPFKIR